MTSYIKTVSVAMLPMVIGGLIGWGVVSNNIESLKEQQRLDSLTLSRVVVMDTTLDFLKENQRLLVEQARLRDMRINDLENGSAGNVEILKGLTLAIKELSGVKSDVIRLKEKAGVY